MRCIFDENIKDIEYHANYYLLNLDMFKQFYVTLYEIS